MQAEYDRLAAGYDARWSFYVATTQTATLDRLPRRDYPRVLDLGCGTGGLLAAMADEHPTATYCGLDLSSAMLGRARTRLSPQILLLAGSADSLPFPSSTFDLVVSVSVLHFWLDPAVCLKEIHRVLRNGGDLVITDWCDDFVACRVCDWYLRRFNAAHVQTYTLDECKGLLSQAGFSAISAERYKISWLWGLMTVRGTK